MQSTDYQREARDRLDLPYELLGDASRRFARALALLTVTVADETSLERLTLVVDDGTVTHVFYPVFPPDGHAAEVREWLASSRR